MKKARLMQITALSLTLLSLPDSLDGDEARAKRLALKKEQRQLARFLKDYRSVKTNELKQSFVEDAIKRGQPYLDGLRRQIEVEGTAGLRLYRQSFLVAIDDASRIAPASVVDTDDKLSQQRSQLLLLREWVDKLSTPKAEPKKDASSTKANADEQLRDREELYIEQWFNAKGFGRVTKIEAMLIRQMNQFRAEEGMPPLEIDYKLCAASRDHSADMTRELFFSHTSELRHKLTYVHRAVRFGTTAISENIANCPSPDMAVPLWKASLGHKRAMLDPKANRVGVGHVGRKITMMFGAGPVEKAEESRDADRPADIR